MLRYPMKLAPVYKDYIWGGCRLKEEYGKDAGGASIAESWELSCHKNGMTSIANGPYSGQTLSAVIDVARAEGADLVGSRGSGSAKFPLLIKLIDAAAALSVQVHPNDAFAAQHENGELGKTEMWYIIDAKPDAQLVYGLSRDVSQEEFLAAAQSGRMDGILNFVPVKKGDCLFIPAGLVHAILDGILIAEIQQNSDTTYRVFDWNRVDKDGRPRALHIEKAAQAATLKKTTVSSFAPGPPDAIPGGYRWKLQQCPYFTVNRYETDSALSLFATGESFHCLTFLEGSGAVCMGSHRVLFAKGDSVYLPAGSGAYDVTGACSFLQTTL